jgi:two-component system phosphate regulon sensor histidine kinase PhoR
MRPGVSQSDFEGIALLEALSEAALVAAGGAVMAANEPARALLGEGIAGAALSTVFADPAVLELIDRPSLGEGEEIELSGLGKSRRQWLVRVADLADGLRLIRLLDRSEARAAEQMRVDFVANASHELRTPLATLVGYTETLRERASEIDPATSQRFLTIVHDEARRMQRIVEDLISLSRIEAERFVAPADAVALGPLIEQALAGVRRAWPRSKPTYRRLPPTMGKCCNCSTISSPMRCAMAKRERRLQ